MTRKKKNVLTWTAVLGSLGAIGMFAWIGPALLNSYNMDPDKFVSASEYSSYVATHKNYGETVMRGYDRRFDSLEKTLSDAVYANNKAHLSQADFNRQFVTRVDAIYDLLLKRLPPAGHADPGENSLWEQYCIP